ncbi:MAG: hypothetical protein QM783_16505 [Phycisphaerales bacterium]
MSKSKMDSKALMAWVKSRWSLVFFAAVALLLVPAMVYFGLGMAESKHAAFEKQVQTDAEPFRSPTVTYSVPSLTSAEKIAEVPHAPNEAMNTAYKTVRDAQQAAAAGVVSEAVKHNQGEGDREHKPLLDGFFPNAGVTNVAMAKQFRRVYVSDAAKALLAIINAKDPVPAGQLVDKLRELERNFLSRELGSDQNEGRGKLSEDKNKALDKEMVDLRLNEYNLWAQKASVYAGMEIFNLPPVVEANTPTPQELWDWQVQYWTMQDVMHAVATVNAPGKDQGIPGSVVKRIEKLTIDADPALGGGPAAPMDPNAPPPVPPVAGAPTADGAPDFTRSFTGHKSGGLFDVRTATLVCVVRTKDIPKFFDALAESNMLTVTSVVFNKVDVAADLKSGYFYGDGEHVTRATIGLEALWMREWTKEKMPKEVKVALGLEAADPNAAPAPGANPAANPPTVQPAGRRAGGAAGG